MSDSFQAAIDSYADTFVEGEALAAATASVADTADNTAVVQAAPAGTSVADAPAGTPVAAEAEGTCAKCKCQLPLTDMIERRSCRKELRYCCKGCNAVQTQCQRKGIQLQSVLSEEQLVSFFAEASLQRRDCEEGRLSFMKSRALLKRHMVEEARREVRDGWRGEFLPLSVWELKGFDTELIRTKAEKEDHPVLGDTFRLDLHSISDEMLHASVEKRLTQLENECLQRRAQSQAGVPELDLLQAAEPEERKRKAGAMSTEEKEALKRQRKEQKKLEGERKSATAAAVKVLPTLKNIRKKLEDKVEKLGEALEQMPVVLHEALVAAQEKLSSTVDICSKLLEAAATGKAPPAAQLPSHKDLQAVSKQASTALRSLTDFVRGQKENNNPNAGKGRGKDKKSN